MIRHNASLDKNHSKLYDLLPVVKGAGISKHTISDLVRIAIDKKVCKRL